VTTGKARAGVNGYGVIGKRVAEIAFTLEPVPPFRLDLTVWVLRRRPDNAVDRWDGESYRRVLVLDGEPVGVTVNQTAPPEAPWLQVTVTGARLAPGVEPAVTAVLDRVLGTRIDLTEFYRQAAPDPDLGPLAARFRGFKPPRFPTLFETLVNAIACQQITLTQGVHGLNRLAETYGSALQQRGAPVAADWQAGGVGTPTPGPTDTVARPPHAFPCPQDLAVLEPEGLRHLGLNRQKARALLELARAIAEDHLNLDGLAVLDDGAAITRLCQFWGVGRWTAEYVLLRGLGRLHVFPGDDVGARGNLRRWLGLEESLDYEGVRRVLRPWQPYAGLVYFHLLLDRLAEAGCLSGVSGR
jgi:DNA-3-methyladenine glycosylase II